MTPSLPSNTTPKPFEYTKPSWAPRVESQLPKGYVLEILKSGSSLGRLPLKGRSYFTLGRWLSEGGRGGDVHLLTGSTIVTCLGRVPVCNVSMDHPSVSRYHAIIQFGTEETRAPAAIYDLGSAHGTRVNRCKIAPKTFTPLFPGDHLVFGESTRTYVFDGPEHVCVLEGKGGEAGKEQPTLSSKDKEGSGEREETGVSGGIYEEGPLGSSGLQKSIDNFQPDEGAYYLNDPKKALRTYLEQQGYAVGYEVEEEGPGHDRRYTARILLPMELMDEHGDGEAGSVYGMGSAGKRRQAEQEAALDGCKKLDARGLLRTGKWRDD